MIKKTDKGTIQINVSGAGKWCKTKASKFIDDFRERRKRKREKNTKSFSERLTGIKLPRMTPHGPDDTIMRGDVGVLKRYKKWKAAPIPKDEFDPSLNLNHEFYMDPRIREDYERELIRKRQLAHDQDMDNFRGSVSQGVPPKPPPPRTTPPKTPTSKLLDKLRKENYPNIDGLEKRINNIKRDATIKALKGLRTSKGYKSLFDKWKPLL